MPYLAIPSPPLAIPPLQVHELLRGAFRELRVIYANYSVDDGDGTDDVADPTLGPSEWQALMLDCRVAAHMSEARLRAVYDAVMATREGDELALDGFVESLVHVAFHRANPSAVTAAPQQPLPGCLERLLRENLLAHAKQDLMFFLGPQLEEDPQAA